MKRYKQRRSELINQLSNERTEMCGIGTRKVKLFLNKKIKEGDSIAYLYRIAVETEDANIKAKKYYGEYRDKYYEDKMHYITLLISKCKEREDVVYGYQKNDAAFPSHIMYFDLPGCEQISFHCSLPKELKRGIPHYDGTWDKKENSTYPKLERAINNRYGEELSEKKQC